MREVAALGVAGVYCVSLIYVSAAVRIKSAHVYKSLLHGIQAGKILSVCILFVLSSWLLSAFCHSTYKFLLPGRYLKSEISAFLGATFVRILTSTHRCFVSSCYYLMLVSWGDPRCSCAPHDRSRPSRALSSHPSRDSLIWRTVSKLANRPAEY